MLSLLLCHMLPDGLREPAVYACVKARFLHAVLEVARVISDAALPLLPLLSMLQWLTAQFEMNSLQTRGCATDCCNL